MADRPAIRVRYCGGCNPEIDRGTLVKAVAAKLVHEASFSAASAPDLILLVNGCPHACLDEEAADADGPRRVSVQGCRVDCRPVGAEGLAAAVVSRIREALKQERNPS